jgi:hypothetical protein
MKKIDLVKTIIILFIFLLSCSVPYFLARFIKSEIYNFTYALAGGLGIWTMFMVFMAVNYNVNIIKQNGGLSWYKYVFFVLGAISTFIMSILLPFVIYASTTNNLETYPNMNFLFTVYLLLLIFSFVNIFFVWRNIIVKSDRIIIIDNKIYYPKQKIFINLFSPPNEINFLPTKFGMNRLDLFVCQDGQYNASLKYSLDINIVEAEKKGLATLDYYDFIIKAGKAISDAMRSKAEKLTIGQLISNNIGKVTKTANGLPFSWDGNAKYVITPIDTNL